MFSSHNMDVSTVNMYDALLCVDVEFCAPIWKHGLDFVEPAMHLSLEERNCNILLCVKGRRNVCNFVSLIQHN